MISIGMSAARLLPKIKRHRILIIDDNQVWCEHIAQAMRQLGHEVRIAATIAGAQGLATRAPPDLVVIDIDFPSLAGLTLVERLTTKAAGAAAPMVTPSRVIVLTDDRDPRIREAVRRLGVEACLVKSDYGAPEVIRCIDAKLMSGRVPGGGGGIVGEGGDEVDERGAAGGRSLSGRGLML